MTARDENGAEQFPRLRLDALLDDLQTRINTARGTQDRIDGLLEAILSIGEELDLSEVLRRTVEVATVLVDARFGALGVIGEDETLTQFLTVGVSEEAARELGPPPTGRGVLGELIQHPHPLRLHELAEHPASYGFPDGHPEMHSFVGVPIRVRDQNFGNLYLTEKRGGGEFDGEDETLLSTLAVAAGVAIENARLYEEAQQREQWVEATAEATRRLLSGVDDIPVLELIVERAREILHADLGIIAVPENGSGDGEPKELQVAVALGRGAEVERHLVIPVKGSLMGTAFTTQEPTIVPRPADNPLMSAGRPHWKDLGPTVAVPLGSGGRVRGALLLSRGKGAPVFTQDEMTPLVRFTGQAALAIVLAERRRGAEQVALFEDRERIARDLHDLAIQRLFATGMTLQSTMRLIEHPEAMERLARAVDDLDETIKIIRSAIFGLRTNGGAGGPAADGLRAAASQAVDDSVELLGFTPALDMEGLIDTDVPHEVGDEALAVLAEALSNIVRHADANAAWISLRARTEEFSVVVTDNGVGLTDDARRGGLRNLGERAERLGGSLELNSPDIGGTRLVWSVPMDTHDHHHTPAPTPATVTSHR